MASGEGHMDVNADDIKSSSGNLETYGGAIGYVQGGQGSALAPYMPHPAGDDKYGQAWEEKFFPALDAANNVLTGLQGGMTKYTGLMEQTADLYTQSGQINREIAGGSSGERE
jgi:hypothetical protein